MAFKDYIPHAVVGTAGTGGLFLVIFRDAINKAWEEYRSDRRMAREARLAASGKDSQLANAFIGLLKSDLESQGKTRDEMAKAIGQLAKSMEQVLDTQRVLSNQINTLNSDMLVVKGAVLGSRGMSS